MQTEDWKAWQWVVGVLGSMLGGAAVGGWVGRGLLESLRNRQEQTEQRMAALEHQQNVCRATIKDEITAIVRQAVADHAIGQTKQLGSIETQVAVLVALHGETQQDIKAIFERMDRRAMEIPLPPSGERRDQ